MCENTLRVLDALGASGVPVYRGLATGVTRDSFPNGEPFNGRAEQSKIHGAHLPLPTATSRVQDEDAISFLTRTYSAEPEPPALVAVGPLTNLAMMLRLHPELAARIPRLVVMGGGHGLGNATSSAEFNIWTDPEAAELGAQQQPKTLPPSSFPLTAAPTADSVRCGDWGRDAGAAERDAPGDRVGGDCAGHRGAGLACALPRTSPHPKLRTLHR